MRIIIFGTGHFGHALADIVTKNHHEVLTWSFREQKPLMELPSGDAYISTLNAQGIEKIGTEIKKLVKGAPIVSATKAFLDADSLTDIFPSKLLGESSLVFSGPNLASEMLLGLPTGATIAGEKHLFDLVAPIFQSPNFYVQHHEDKMVVELMGIMKNIIAIGIGIIEGLALGENLKGIFIARMCRDIADFSLRTYGEIFDISTLYAGIGDIFTTCSSSESRNHGFGLYFARTKSIRTAIEFMNSSVEGLHSIQVLGKFGIGEKFLGGYLELFRDDGKDFSGENFMCLFTETE